LKEAQSAFTMLYEKLKKENKDGQLKQEFKALFQINQTAAQYSALIRAYLPSSIRSSSLV